MNQPNPELPDDPVYSRKVLEMLTVANEFCLFIEKSVDYPLTELLQFLQKVCPLIYLKASLLPDIMVENEDVTEHYVTEEQWESVFGILRGKFGERDVFYFIDKNEKSHLDPQRGSLAECFADIYQDLKDFLLLYQKPQKAFKENAVRDCKYLFETRFGYRLVEAQTAIHYMLCQNNWKETEPEPED